MHMLLQFFIIPCQLLLYAVTTKACSYKNCIVPLNYDKKIRPNADKGLPVDIKFQVYVESFGSIDVAKMEMDVFGYMIQRWRDDRLANLSTSTIILASKDTGDIWLPDIYCINCKKSNLDSGNNLKESLVRIDKNGNIYFSVGISLVSSCEMNLKDFPFDRQLCDLKFSSFAYNMSYLNYTWMKNPFVKITEMDQFIVTDVSSHTRIDDYNGHLFPISIGFFTLERRVGFYILQLYIPTAMLVCLSWAMFCLDQDHLGDRITIGLTLFLTMIFLHGYANTSLPRVSYIKSVDLFMVFSLLEILLTLLESLVVTSMYMRAMKQKEKLEQREQSESITQALVEEKRSLVNNECSGDVDNHNGIFQRSGKYANRYSREIELKILPGAHQSPNNEDSEMQIVSDERNKNQCLVKCPMYLIIEKCCTVLLPLSYIVFNAWYWAYYMYFVHQNNHN